MLAAPHFRSNGFSPRLSRWNFRLVYRRDGWDLRSSAKTRRFPTLEAAMEHVRWLQSYKAGGGRVLARIDHRDHGRWHEVPELARVWAEGGWSR
jgi:aminoglycoside phosphotransferase